MAIPVTWTHFLKIVMVLCSVKQESNSWKMCGNGTWQKIWTGLLVVFKQKIKINTNNSTTKKSLELSASKLLQASTCTFYHSQ